MSGRHLTRLEEIWTESPIFFVTTCTRHRRPILDSPKMHNVCREVWDKGEERQGWIVGRYMLMPDHVHFFCTPRTDRCRLEVFVGKWKEWTAKLAHRRLSISAPLWQAEFFDHVLRSSESYEQKWLYVRDNPVRAGLVSDSAQWLFQGEVHRLDMDG